METFLHSFSNRTQQLLLWDGCSPPPLFLYYPHKYLCLCKNKPFFIFTRLSLRHFYYMSFPPIGSAIYFTGVYRCRSVLLIRHKTAAKIRGGEAHSTPASLEGAFESPWIGSMTLLLPLLFFYDKKKIKKSSALLLSVCLFCVTVRSRSSLVVTSVETAGLLKVNEDDGEFLLRSHRDFCPEGW